MTWVPDERKDSNGTDMITGTLTMESLQLKWDGTFSDFYCMFEKSEEGASVKYVIKLVWPNSIYGGIESVLFQVAVDS
jgi:hypothetical protein